MTNKMKKITLDEAVSIYAQTGMVIDDHTKDAEQIAGIGELEGGKLFSIHNARYFSINELYLSATDNKLHASIRSIAGTVVPVDHDMDINRAIKAYNDAVCKYRDWLNEKYPEEAPHTSGKLITEYRMLTII